MAKGTYLLLLVNVIISSFVLFHWEVDGHVVRNMADCHKYFHLRSNQCHACRGQRQTVAASNHPEPEIPLDTTKLNLLSNLRAIRQNLVEANQNYLSFMNQSGWTAYTDLDFAAIPKQEVDVVLNVQRTRPVQMQSVLTEISLFMQLASTRFAMRHGLTITPWNDIYVIRASCQLQRIIKAITCDLQLAIQQSRTGLPVPDCRKRISIDRSDEPREMAGYIYSLLRKSMEKITEAFELYRTLEWPQSGN